MNKKKETGTEKRKIKWNIFDWTAVKPKMCIVHNFFLSSTLFIVECAWNIVFFLFFFHFRSNSIYSRVCMPVYIKLFADEWRYSDIFSAKMYWIFLNFQCIRISNRHFWFFFLFHSINLCSCSFGSNSVLRFSLKFITRKLFHSKIKQNLKQNQIKAQKNEEKLKKRKNEFYSYFAFFLLRSNHNRMNMKSNWIYVLPSQS